MPNAKIKRKKSNNKSNKSKFLTTNKLGFGSNSKKSLTGLFIILVISIIGASILVFSQAAPNNCQTQDGIPICDVDQSAWDQDSVLSRGSEAKSLASRGWIYYGAAFRAPAHAYKGAVPITRIYNQSATYHDFVTPSQKSTKEAKYKGKTRNEGVAFYAWNTKITGTVPVYRLTRAGNHTQTIFSTDKAWVDRLLATDKGKDDGWKKDNLAPFVAFYAYPPNYKVVNKVDDKVVATPNPYDCSIEANFISDRCKTQRENLATEVKQGNVPKDNSCPKTLSAYLKAPLVGELTSDCQKYWNTYMQNCSIQENYVSDRCTKEREAIAKAQLEQIRARQEAQRNDASSGSSGSSSYSSGGSGKSISPTIAANTGGVDCGVPANYLTNSCTVARKNLAYALYYSTLPTTTNARKNPKESIAFRYRPSNKGTCVVGYWASGGYGGLGGTTIQRKKYYNITYSQCNNNYSRDSKYRVDVYGRALYGYTKSWSPNGGG